MGDSPALDLNHFWNVLVFVPQLKKCGTLPIYVYHPCQDSNPGPRPQIKNVDLL